jgi:single-strand DNA-binding protein
LKNDSGSYNRCTEWHRIVVWGKLSGFAARLSKGAHIEVEGQLRHRTYQKEIAAGKKNIAVDMTVTEIHASAIRKLDRSSSPTESGDQNVSEGAPE